MTATKVVQEHVVMVVEKPPVDGEGQDKPGRHARSLLHLYLFSGDEVFTPVERLSYGERARLVLARLVLSGATLLLLDEPTNHLDIPSRERFEQALSSYAGTVLAVLHDRYLIDRLATRVVALRDGKMA